MSDFVDLTKLVPIAPPHTLSASKLRQRLNQLRQQEFADACRTITIPAAPAVTKKDSEWIAKRRPKKRSQFRGVTWKADRGKWEAWYTVGAMRVSVGTYAEEVDAARARDEALDRLGKTGPRNLPPMKGSE